MATVRVFFDFACRFSRWARPREVRAGERLGLVFEPVPWELFPGGGRRPPILVQRVIARVRCGEALPTRARNGDTRLALGGVLPARRAGKLEAYMERAYAVYWDEGRDLDADVLSGIAKELGMDPEAFLRDARSAEAEAMLKAADAEAERLGIAEAPAYVLPDGAVVPGLLREEAWLARLGTAAPGPAGA